jgi:hypothetical protein
LVERLKSNYFQDSATPGNYASAVYKRASATASRNRVIIRSNSIRALLPDLSNRID